MIFFSKNLKYLRQLRKLSQEELGLNIGLNRGNIASYENGSAEPKLQNLLNIANFFDISVSEMVSTDLQFAEELSEEDKPLNELIRQLGVQAESYKRIIEGFKAYHTYKISKEGLREINAKEVAEDYIKLLDVSESFLQHHLETLQILKDQK